MSSNFVKEWYARMKSEQRHIDHIAGDIQRKHFVYQPNPFIVGQGESYSDITYRNEFRRTWNQAPPNTPVILLDCPRPVRDALADRLHYGYNVVNGIDRGLAELMTKQHRAPKLRNWIQLVAGEAHAIGKTCAIYHPEITPELARAACRNLHYIKAKSTVDVLTALSGIHMVSENCA